MDKRCFFLLVILASVLSSQGFTLHRSFQNGYPSTARSATVQRRSNVLTNSVRVAEGFSKFRNKTWVTGVGEVTKILEDDLEPPCHQRFILSDKNGQTILIAHNIDECERLSGLSVGDTVAFKGEYIINSKGGVVHWTHPSHSAYKPSGWVKTLKRAYPCKKAAD